jgi:hypothetical protein
MAKKVQRRRGTASEHAVFTTGAHGEVTVSLPDSPVASADKTAAPAELYVHYGDGAVGERFISRGATVDLIKEYIDRQVFLARITGYVPMNSDTPGGQEEEQIPNRWMYQWEEVAIHTPISHQVKVTLTFDTDGDPWVTSPSAAVINVQLPYHAIANPGVNNATGTATTYTPTMKSYATSVTRPGGSITEPSREQFRDSYIAAFNSVSASAASSVTQSAGRMHTASAGGTANEIIFTRNIGETVNSLSATYNASTTGLYTGSISVTGSPADITGGSMQVLTGAYKDEVNTGNWDGDVPTLDGLFMQYGVTNTSPAITATKGRRWSSVDSTAGKYYALNTLEFSNFHVENAVSETEGYGVTGAGVSVTQTNNPQSEHDANHVRAIVDTGDSSTSKVFSKRYYPPQYAIEPIAAGTVVVMHERWTASTSGEADYAGMVTPGGVGAAAGYDGTNVTAGSPSTSDAKYTPAPPFYYFSVPNVHQGPCGT